MFLTYLLITIGVYIFFTLLTYFYSRYYAKQVNIILKNNKHYNLISPTKFFMFLILGLLVITLLINIFPIIKIKDTIVNADNSAHYNLISNDYDATDVDDDYFDHGHENYFTPEVGVGECAGASYDMVGIIVNDAKIKQEEANEAMQNQLYAEAIYYAYTGFVVAAKALLLSKDVECNTQIKILQDFDTHIINENRLSIDGNSFEQMVLAINQNEPSEAFAKQYVAQFKQFLEQVVTYRNQFIEDKPVLESNYKA